MVTATKAAPSTNLELWFAKGMAARAKSVDRPTVNFKGCEKRQWKWVEGWNYLQAHFSINKVPLEPADVDALVSSHFRRATREGERHGRKRQREG